MTIMEESSKKPPGKGRPPVYHPVRIKWSRDNQMHRETITDRTAQDNLHAFAAMAVLFHEPDYTKRYAWLLTRRTLLTELGRIADTFADADSTVRALATDLCNARPPVREAAASLRAWRLGRTRPVADLEGLVNHLHTAISTYAQTHSGLDRELLMLAVRCLEWDGEPILAEPEGEEPIP